MTYKQALKKLKETRELSTKLLVPLNISFESFLRYAQLSEEQQENLMDKLIENLERTVRRG